MKQRAEKKDTVFFNQFGCVNVNMLRTKKYVILLIDGEDVYGKLEKGKVIPLREPEARFSLKVDVYLDKDGNEQVKQEGIVLDVCREE
jgi:hypothetical protein